MKYFKFVLFGVQFRY